ncbi:hypothetical protein [Streptomyces sp. MAR25Y5]|uniref:hypothetical protein n=1 Tax=Streptomyces sp. MAR25Y5 TaxID=2962028 RepID=UPI0020B756A6|nr:hypothetical protein [Streptomyces sp. MAR25Y5]MCP3767006.1 hypothetical protein [Streptomyces sp. MAR25Y5]
MSTESSRGADRARPASGALLLCRAEPGSVVPAARLLHERMLLARAGDEWSVLVPEGGPWRSGADPVERVVNGWAIALTVGVSWPVLALWWDGERAGFTLAAGFRRPVGYVWLADGTPAGVEEAVRTFADRLGLDPVLDMQALEELTEPDADADAAARLSGVLAVLTRAGVFLPPGLVPGDPTDTLLEAALFQPDTRRIGTDGSDGRSATDGDERGPRGRRQKQNQEEARGRAREQEQEGTREVREPARPGGVTGAGLPAPRPFRAGGPHSVPALALVQVAAGLPLAVWGLRHRSGGWILAGTVLLAQGTLTLTGHVLTHPRD